MLKARQLATWSAVLIVTGLALFPLFIRMREIYYANGTSGDAFIDIYNAASGFDWEVRGLSADEEYSANVAQRSLIIRFVCRIIESQEQIEPMYGKALGSSLMWVLPSLLYAKKHNNIQTEQFIQLHHGHPLEDTATTWPAIGCADFSVLGGLLAGVLVGSVLFALSRLADAIAPKLPFMSFLVIGAVVNFSVFVEEDASLIWTILRSIFILLPIAISYSALFPKKHDARTAPTHLVGAHSENPQAV